MIKNKFIKLFFKATIGISLFLWIAYTLYNQIQHQPNLQNTIHDLYVVWNPSKIVFLSVVFILMIFNWTIEAQKWRLLLIGTEKFSLWKSLQSVLTGVAFSVITPNRIGEYMGRILFLRNVHKIQGITVTIIGSFAQLIVTGFLGLLGSLYYILNVQKSSWLIILLVTSLLLFTFLTYLYFNLHKLLDWTNGVSIFRKGRIYLKVVKRFNQQQLINILLISTGRYIIYTIQFIMLLKFFLVDINNITLLCTVWLIFWIMAILPTIAIAEIGIRGEAALFFLAPLSTNHLGIVSSTFMLWFINLIIPSLIGCLFVYKMKLYKDE